MGYTTDFDGHINVSPPLNANEIAYLKKFNETRRMKRTKGPYYVQGTGCYGQGHDDDIINHNDSGDQPGLWCKWTPTEDGTAIEWDQCEKFYDSVEWMQYLIDHFLKPDALAKTQTIDGKTFFTFQDHTLQGAIEAQGEAEDDHWYLVVRNNVAETRKTLPRGLKLIGTTLMLTA